jgi:aspartyl-tRNA(Asn)/glutamyl-tRNA(Gln) amidotransferase subunit B
LSSEIDTDFEPVIGLEVHIQLKTQSKMFCGCERAYFDTEPNSHVCVVCMGMPGSLPVINRQAVLYTVMAGLALNCNIPSEAKFDRKNYPYPDLMKGYQISQFDQPFCEEGTLTIETESGAQRDVQLERIHLEEDTARLIHRSDSEGSYSLLDLNRAGSPLMELVTKPDIRSAGEAASFLKRLRQMARYLGISDANMEKGQLRCDANISVRPKGVTELGTKVEIKNMNSFRSVQKAIDYEISRQISQIRAGERIIQETRGFIDSTGETISQRSKEGASDYRYFPEPDLPPLSLTDTFIDEVRSLMPELPSSRLSRFTDQYQLTSTEAITLTDSKARSNAYEKTLQIDETVDPKEIAKWFIGEIAKHINELGVDAELSDTKVTPEQISKLVKLVESKKITNNAGREILTKMFASGREPEDLVELLGLKQNNDTAVLESAIKEVLENNPKAIADYRGGKDSAIGFLLGQTMRATKGTADANIVRGLLLSLINS